MQDQIPHQSASHAQITRIRSPVDTPPANHSAPASQRAKRTQGEKQEAQSRRSHCCRLDHRARHVEVPTTESVRDQLVPTLTIADPLDPSVSGFPNLDLMPLMTIDILLYHTDPTEACHQYPMATAQTHRLLPDPWAAAESQAQDSASPPVPAPDSAPADP